jgi:anti-sigma regulatory factor (Ser/Thr protein kinase)
LKPAKIVLHLLDTNLGQELDCLHHWLTNTANCLGLSDRTLLELDLVLNEVVPNIICYAYAEQESGDISLSLTENGEHVLLEIVDQGIPFNPFAQEEYQPGISLASAPINGRGIHLIKSFTVTQEYQRIGDSNRISLSFSKTSSV